MVRVTIANATQDDAEAMAAMLNPFQVKLIIALGDKTVLDCVNRSFGGSTAAWSGRVDNELVAMWGVYPLEGGCGYPWLYSTPRLMRLPKTAYVVAHHAIKEMLALYPRLFGVVDSRFPESVRFARHLGFSVGAYPTEPPFVAIERLAA